MKKKSNLFSIGLAIEFFSFSLVLPSITQAASDWASNPLLSGFDDLLFVERSIRTDLTGSEFDGDHMCDQTHAFNARKGGGLYILKNFKSGSPQLVNVVAGLTVPEGINKGMLLSDGAFYRPDLSYDGKTVVFAWTSGGNTPWAPENRWNLFRVDIDGTNLKRLTNINQDDFDPCWLPNGRIVFVSTRRGGFGRCHSVAKPTFTMYSMKADGSDLYCIDWHETNEWQPSVDNDGMIVYSRWDYIDRDSDIAHHFWICYPDGRDPRAYHGNYPYPLSTIPDASSFNLFKGDGRHQRPWLENNIRAIPNTTGKYVATAALHHGQAFGSLILIDVTKRDDHMTSQITRLTPEVKFPEAESGTGTDGEKYGTAWPLSEQVYLCNYLNGIYLLDAASGTKQLIYQSKADKFRPIYPIPAAARKVPPVIPTFTYQGERLTPDAPNATITVLNVYNADIPLPKDVKIKYMRMVEVFPKTTIAANSPRVHYGEQGLCRMSLGTVPVEEDGSVYCLAPVGKEIFFQVLDEKGMAVQSMRSGTYVHPGEAMTCAGCHEDKWTATPAPSQPLALKRPPSQPTPEPPGLEPINFYRTVKPVLDSKCAPCHRQMGKGPALDYGGLRSYAFFFDAGGNGSIMNGVSGGSRTIPLRFGAHYSKICTGGHLESTNPAYSLSDDERRRITMWLDLSSYELSSYENVDAQRQGKLVWPSVDGDSINPQGIERRITAAARPAMFGPAGRAPDIYMSRCGSVLKISLPADGAYRLTLTNASGRTVRRAQARGRGTALLSLEGYGSGIYFCTVSNGPMTLSRKLLLYR